jgi:zinc transport system substrate-binding protein
MSRNKPRIIVAGIMLAAAAVVGWFLYSNSNNISNSVDTKVKISTSFYPLYEFTQQVVGTNADVATVTPAGVEPHDFEPSPQQLAGIIDSQLFIYIGGELEPWVEKFIQENNVRSLRVTDGLVPESDARDPHVWLNPDYAQQIAGKITDTVQQIDSQNTESYKELGQNYILKLKELDEEMMSGLQDCASRTIVTAHDAFGYFGKRYNLEVIPVSGISPEDEPSAQNLAALSTLVRQKNVSTVFFETLTDPQLAETLAKEAGVQTAVLDPIEGIESEDQAEESGYISAQKSNLQALRLALSCK